MAVRPVAFYAVSNADHFIGLVALLNSLRLAGHDEPLVVADCGLEKWQREALAPHTELTAVDAGGSPHLLKGVLPLARSAGVMALLDADLIVLRPLTPLLEGARAGRVVVFADPVAHRFDSRWEALLELPPLRRQPYINSGLVVLPAQPGRRVLEAMALGKTRVDFGESRFAGGQPSNPFYYVDQDLLNAVLASLLSEDELEILETRLAPHPPFAGIRLDDAATVPYVLHHIDRKPWLAATRSNLYTEILPRFLLADDVTLRLESRRVPLRFRDGPLSALERIRIEAAALAHQQRGKLGLRRRLRERLGSRRAGA
jgi:hypothetical protein